MTLGHYQSRSLSARTIDLNVATPISRQAAALTALRTVAPGGEAGRAAGDGGAGLIEVVSQAAHSLPIVTSYGGRIPIRFHTIPNGVPECASKCDLSVKIAGQAYLDASGGVEFTAPEVWRVVGI
jgi:hypothetical protein